MVEQSRYAYGTVGVKCRGGLGMIDFNALKRMLKDFHGIETTVDELKRIYSRLPIDQIKEQQRNRIKVKVWEGELISGVDLYNHPNPVLRRQYRKVIDAGGKIYMILIDDKIRYLQYHKPFVAGIQPIREEELESVIKSHVDRVVEDLTNQEVINRIIKALKSEL